MPRHDDTAQQITEIIRTINKTCIEGKGFDTLAPLFHDDVVVVPPGFTTHIKGRDTCLKSYEDGFSQTTFEKLEASEERVDVYDSTAVASYKYDCIWEFKGKRFEEDGYEILVCVKEDRDWKIVWRTLIPGQRQIEPCPVQEAKAGVEAPQDIKQTCRNLLAAMPVCYLTTMDADGFPHTTAMLNLRCAKEFPSLVGLHEDSEEEFLLYLTTSLQSGKMARMQANPKVSAYFCDPDQIVGLMLGGEIEIVTDQALKNRVWQDGWTMYYPNGPEGDEYGVVRLAPAIIKGWCRNQPFVLKP
ncbi:MAG: DUF4440 domain-containing protein [Phycisphaerales bacterium]|nr:MAG: DUF4440 domain-containing protein [Phycisphaerales bacterium]